MSNSQKRKDVVAFCCWLLFILILAVIGFMTSGCDSQPIPFADGGQDVQIHLDGQTDTGNPLIDTMGGTEGDAATDSTDVADSDPPKIDAPKCPLPDADCSLTLNPDPQNICVSPTMGPYTSLFACGSGKRVCCVPSPKGSLCAFLTCVAL